MVLFKTTRFYNKARLQDNINHKSVRNLPNVAKRLASLHFTRSACIQNCNIFFYIPYHCVNQRKFERLSFENVTVINLLIHLLLAKWPNKTLLLSLKAHDDNWSEKKQPLKICMARTHRGQVVSRNRTICLIVGDVVCLCASTATVLEIKVIN